MSQVFKLRAFQCACGEKLQKLAWNYDAAPTCKCGATMEADYEALGQAAAVIGDEIDEVHAHGICHPDGTPRRVRSRTEKRELLRQHGLCVVGDTPKVDSRRAEESHRRRERGY